MRSVAETATLRSFSIMDYLVNHLQREFSEIGDLKIYHDYLSDNQYPYLWNDHLLHSYCHITELRVESKNILFWVS